jgi:hypothetical protein
MRIVRTTLATMLAIVLFTSVAALAIASPPAGNPAGGCGQGPPADRGGGPPGGQYGPPGNQYGGPSSPPGPPSPPGNQYGPPGNQYEVPPGHQYGVEGNNGTPGGPSGCPASGQYRP